MKTTTEWGLECVDPSAQCGGLQDDNHDPELASPQCSLQVTYGNRCTALLRLHVLYTTPYYAKSVHSLFWDPRETMSDNDILVDGQVTQRF